MSETVRFGVSLGLDLLDDFDRLIKKLQYGSRSEAVRDLIREKLVEEEWEVGARQTYGVVLLVYDHRQRQVANRLVGMQHDSLSEVIGSFHVHIDAKHCLEVVVMKGKGAEVRAIGQGMISMKGVKYGRLHLGASGQSLH
jgi:CopG family nickel-responsive transcriptional regulator